MVYTVTNPLGAMENAVIGAVLGGTGGAQRSGGNRPGTFGGRSNTSGSHIASGSGVRAAEAIESGERLAQLLAVQRERFVAVQRPTIAEPEPVDPESYSEMEWERRKPEVRVWQRARRKQLQHEVQQYAQERSNEAFAKSKVEQRLQQAEADCWWEDLNHGVPLVVTSALNAAFADNPAPVIVVHASGSEAVLYLSLPGPDVLPQKKANITPTGRLSSKAWTKTEFNEIYAELLGAHLLGTIREAWAVAPCLLNLRIVGGSDSHDHSNGGRFFNRGPVDNSSGWSAASEQFEIFFDVAVAREDGHWTDDGWGTKILAHARYGLNRIGKAQEVRAWPLDKLSSDLLALLTS